MDDEWERNSAWWVDGFTEGNDSEYVEQIVPIVAAELASASRVLDVGCGEGQLARRAVAGGAHAVGVDASVNQLRVGVERAGGVAYARADATALPFAGASFDAVVACLVLEHVDELERAAAEISRTLEEGGVLCCVLNHPFIQTPGSGLIDDDSVDPPEVYWRVGAYLVEWRGVEEVERGVEVSFVHRPLSRYVNAFAEVGLTIEHMVEPEPLADSFATATDAEVGLAVPRLLYLRFRKRA